jgi:hypothetical protein
MRLLLVAKINKANKRKSFHVLKIKMGRENK